MHNIFDEFEFRPGRTMMGKRCLHLFLVVFDPIILMHAGKENMH